MSVLNWISGILMAIALILPSILSGWYKKINIFLVGVAFFILLYIPLAIKVFFFTPDNGGYDHELLIWQIFIIGLLKIFLSFLIGCLIMAIGNKRIK